MKRLVFMNRRRQDDRRFAEDTGEDHPFDLTPRKRRKSKERRDHTRTLTDDYYAFMQKTIDLMQSRLQSRESKPKNR